MTIDLSLIFYSNAQSRERVIVTAINSSTTRVDPCKIPSVEVYDLDKVVRL